MLHIIASTADALSFFTNYVVLYSFINDVICDVLYYGNYWSTKCGM